MLSNELANKYAKAVFELAVEEEKLQEVENDLKFIVQTISSQQDLSDFIYHPHVKLEAKKEISTKNSQFLDFENVSLIKLPRTYI